MAFGGAKLRLGATHPRALEHENFGAMAGRMAGVGRASDELFRTLGGFLGRAKPAGRALAPDEEERLCRYCFVLACFEQVYRAGARSANPLFSQTATTAHALLVLPPPTPSGISERSRAAFTQPSRTFSRGRPR
jgi:hypothetical protein